MTSTPWLELLEPLRSKLKGRDHRGKRGSLRWLEAVMTEQGGRSGTVRNILYKDLGSHSEKQRMFEILKGLYEEAGLSVPDRPEELKTADAKKLLGRDKRVIYARFSRALQLQERPQMIVVGQPSTGKGILLEQLSETHAEHLFANLANDLAPALHTLAHQLGITEAYQKLLALLSSTHPYALQAQHQRDILQLFLKHLNQATVPLFLRAEESAVLSGLSLRDDSGQEVGLSTWLEPVLKALNIPYLVACSSAPASLSYKMLRAPSRQEARIYLRQRLPDVPVETLEHLLNRAGRNYGELSRLSLLELCRAGEKSESQLHTDPRLGPLLVALAVLSPEVDPEIPLDLLEQVLAKRITDLSQAEQALLESTGDASFHPALRSFLPTGVDAKAIHEQALNYYLEKNNDFRVLYHAFEAGALDILTERLRASPSQLGLLPNLWEKAFEWPENYRETLALSVVQYRSVLGDYAHPECKEALNVLSASDNKDTSAWAKVKMAEAFIDEGQYQKASTFAKDMPDFSGDAKAEALLVKAALGRWQGDYELAEDCVNEVLALEIPPVLTDRAKLWQGLVAKDAGDFKLALKGLRAVQHLPLLVGRARYQEGDILLRIGHSDEGVLCLREALKKLHESASAEEKARVRARLGTGLRRTGGHREAAIHFRRALKESPDAFTRSRIASEASIFESARGRPKKAIELASEAETFFRKTKERPEEAAYRHRRTLYRLAVAYWVWQVGEAYCAPLRGGQSSQRAMTIIQSLLPQVTPLAQEADRYASLYLDIHVLLSLMLPAQEAWEQLKNIHDLPHSYLQQQLSLAKVEVLLRQGDAKSAAAELMSVRNLPPDPSLQTWKSLLEAEMMLKLDQAEVSKEIITEALQFSESYRYQLGRRWGQILEETSQQDLACEWVTDNSSPLGLAEALAIAFARLSPKN